MNDSARPASRRAYLATLFLLALGFMLFQISILRELRYALNTLFTLTPFVFSIVIVFIGLGSFAAERVPWTSSAPMRWGVVLAPVLTLPLFAVTLFLARVTIDRSAGAFAVRSGVSSASEYIGAVAISFVVTAVLGYGLVFFLQGFIFALYFREGRSAGILSRLYALDLFASGVGALIGGVLSSTLAPISCTLLSAVFLLAALVVSRPHLRQSGALVAAATVLVIGSILLDLRVGFLASLESPDYLGKVSYTTWSPYRRIDAVETPSSLNVYTDGLLFQEYDRNDRQHSSNPRVLPAVLLEASSGRMRDVLVIGSGSGADVQILRDRVKTPLRIVAVELDEGFIRTARQFPWLWETYKTADIRVEEGRYFLESTPDSFDMVVYAYIDPQAAISKLGIPDANFLYTSRGIRKAYEHVRPGGYLTISRVFLADQTPEFFRRLYATLRAAGIPENEIALYRGGRSVAWGYYGRLDSALAIVRKGGPLPRISAVPVAPEPGGRPTTDLYPFSLVTDAWFGALWRYVRSNVIVLVCLALVAALLLFRIATNVSRLHFFLLGFGSFLVESLVLLNSFLLIGNPTASAAMAVGFLLLWCGIGSLYSEWLEQRPRWFLAVPLVMLAYALSAPLVGLWTIALAPWVRIAVFAVHLIVPGVLMGAMFPISLRAFASEPVPALFFIDLIGCGIAPIAFWLAMSLAGVSVVAGLSVLAYGTVTAVLLARGR